MIANEQKDTTRVVPKKKWGQNFCKDERLLERMVSFSAMPMGTRVIEVGPGLGALTAVLLQADCKVMAIEKDKTLLPHLEKRFAPYLTEKPRLLLQQGCILNLDYGSCVKEGYSIIYGNLPYNIASRMLVQLSGCSPCIEKGIFLVQWEVARRLIAQPGSSDYGLLSVLIQRTFDVRILEKVPPHVFYPQPKVDSAVIFCQLKEQPLSAEDSALCAQIARLGFAMRRKMLKKNLGQAFPQAKAFLACWLEDLGFQEDVRAERLAIKDFVTLGHLLKPFSLASYSIAIDAEI